jgi:hypothetical protein
VRPAIKGNTIFVLRQQVRCELLIEAEKNSATKLLPEIPSIGPILAKLSSSRSSPHFRTKRQLWTDIAFGIETCRSAEHRYIDGELQRLKKPISIRGLNRIHHDLKNLFESAATVAAAKPEPFQEFDLTIGVI